MDLPDNWESLYDADRVSKYIVAVETGYGVGFKFWLSFQIVNDKAEWSVFSSPAGELADQLPDYAKSRPWQVYTDEPNAWPQAIYWSVKAWEMWFNKYRTLGDDRPSL